MPSQLGYGIPLGCEAVVHSARQYLKHLPSDHVMLKLISLMRIRRDKMLQAAHLHIPEIFPFIFSCYSTPSLLLLGDTSILLAEGVQQGDPLGPLLFCLVIHPLVLRLKSEFKVFYLDDGTIGGSEFSALPQPFAGLTPARLLCWGLQ